MSDRDKRNLDEAMRFGWDGIESWHVKALKNELERLRFIELQWEAMRVLRGLRKETNK